MSLRILLIDDEPTVLDVIALMLTFDGHTVLTATNGRQGLARLEAGEVVDLVLTDLMMPELSGWRSCGRSGASGPPCRSASSPRRRTIAGTGVRPWTCSSR